MSATNSLSGLLDTNILIDIIRRYPPAIAWANANATQRYAIPSLVRMELVLGTGNRQDQRKVVDFLTPYPLVYPDEADARWALERFEALHLSHQVEIMDCFIAALSARLELPIYSRNVRDLGVFGGVAVVTPY